MNLHFLKNNANPTEIHGLNLFLILYFYIYFTRAIIYGITGYLVEFLPIYMLVLFALGPITFLFLNPNLVQPQISTGLLVVTWFVSIFVNLSIVYMVIVFFANALVIYTFRSLIYFYDNIELKTSMVIIPSLFVFDTVMRTINQGKDMFLHFSIFALIVNCVIIGLFVIIIFSLESDNNSPLVRKTVKNSWFVSYSVIALIGGIGVYLLIFANYGLFQISLGLDNNSALLVHLWSISVISLLFVVFDKLVEYLDILTTFVLLILLILSTTMYPWMNLQVLMQFFGYFAILSILVLILQQVLQVQRNDNLHFSLSLALGYIVNVLIIQQTILSDDSTFRLIAVLIFSIIAYASIFKLKGDE